MWIIIVAMKTYTSNQVAELTGRTRRTVLQAAKNHKEIGHKHGRDWVFTDADIALIKAMKPGRPPAAPTASTPKPGRKRRAKPAPATAQEAQG